MHPAVLVMVFRMISDVFRDAMAASLMHKMMFTAWPWFNIFFHKYEGVEPSTILWTMPECV